jgi:hypothetical protein
LSLLTSCMTRFISLASHFKSYFLFICPKEFLAYYVIPPGVRPSVRTCHLNGLKGHFFCYFLLFNRGPWPLILLLRNELYCSLLFCLQLDGPLLLLNSMDGRPSVRPLAIWFPEHNLSSIWPTIFKLHRMIVHIG